MGCDHRPSFNPRLAGSCVRCGRSLAERPRNLALERALCALAARAAGLPHDGGLGAFADARALPGGVRHEGRDFVRETAEELADARNYLCWRLEAIYAACLAGHPDATDEYVRLMGTLRALVEAWHALHGA